MRRLKYDRIIVGTILVALISMVIGLGVLTQVKNQLILVSTEEHKKQQSQLAGQVADILSQNLTNVQNQLKLMASMNEVQDLSNPDICNKKLSELLEIGQKQLGNLGRVDAEGYFRCSVNPAIIGQHTSMYGSYVQDLQNDPDHKPVLSRLTRPAGVDSFVSAMHVPVYKEGKYDGTLGGALYFNKFQDSYLSGIKFGNSGHVVVMDDNGDILYHPSSDQNGKNLLDPAVLKFFEPESTMRSLLDDVKMGRSGTFDYSVQGTQKIGIYKTFSVPGTIRHWSVIVTIPIEDLEHVVNQAGINRIFIILFLLLAFTIVSLTVVSLHNTIKNLEIQRMKDDFISITSHQLRTPATIVKQNLGLIQGGYVTTNKDIRKFVDSAYESNEVQLGIIENILSVSKIEAGRLQIQRQEIVLQSLIDRLTTSLKISIASKKHKLSVDIPAKPIRLSADPTKLSMAIENLVSNAVKYTPAKGKITIKARTRKGIVSIAVADNGRGIPKEDIQKLFIRFNRLNSAEASNLPGTGLGLYLTKKIVELHGGEITVNSTEKSGTTFTIRLPIK